MFNPFKRKPKELSKRTILYNKFDEIINIATKNRFTVHTTERIIDMSIYLTTYVGIISKIKYRCSNCNYKSKNISYGHHERYIIIEDTSINLDKLTSENIDDIIEIMDRDLDQLKFDEVKMNVVRTLKRTTLIRKVKESLPPKEENDDV